MKSQHSFLAVVALFLSLCCAPSPLFAESQNNDYKGISDPFGDPSNYEFAEDEKEDKEFFHLGRFFMIGFDMGMGIYTGGLGIDNEPGLYVGAKIVYFFDRSLAFEAAVHYGTNTAFLSSTIETSLIPLTGGFRFYFDTRDAPRALSLANPYLVGGAGVYLRDEMVTKGTGTNGSNGNFGLFGGAGLEFNIYRKHLYLGLDLRYHMIFFVDEADVTPGQNRDGDYFTPAVTFTYNF